MLNQILSVLCQIFAVLRERPPPRVATPCSALPRSFVPQRDDLGLRVEGLAVWCGDSLRPDIMWRAYVDSAATRVGRFI